MTIIQMFPIAALASFFTVLIPISAMAISDYQSGYDDGYAAAQVSNGVYTIGDACEHQSTQYCNGFLAGYTTEFFALYQNIPTTIVVHEVGSNVVIIHPHQYYTPHPPFVVVHRHVVIGPPTHRPPVSIQSYPFYLGHFGDTGPGHSPNLNHGPSTVHGGPGPSPEGHHGH